MNFYILYNNLNHAYQYLQYTYNNLQSYTNNWYAIVWIYYTFHFFFKLLVHGIYEIDFKNVYNVSKVIIEQKNN